MRVKSMVVWIVLGVLGACVLVSWGFDSLMSSVMMDTYSHVYIDRYISSDEIKHCPIDISDGEAQWFNDLLDEQCLDELETYMKENRLLIPPGDYLLSNIQDCETAIEKLDFVREETVGD